jgi:hypothetical protein
MTSRVNIVLKYDVSTWETQTADNPLSELKTSSNVSADPRDPVDRSSILRGHFLEVQQNSSIQTDFS